MTSECKNVLLIDQEGILRADDPYPLDKEVAKLLQRPSEPSK